jgi:hypothetical protein
VKTAVKKRKAVTEKVVAAAAGAARKVDAHPLARCCTVC